MKQDSKRLYQKWSKLQLPHRVILKRYIVKLCNKKSRPVLKFNEFKSEINKRIRRTRQKLVPQCKGAIDLGIFMKNDKFYREKFAVFRNEQFYRTNILYNDTNACIFVVQQFISIGLSHLWIDGTFSIIPKCFAQLLIVFSEINTMIYPIGYILMETRKKGLYMAVFKYLKETLKINPFKVIVINEAAL
ncbi:hypothetical protein PVAND_013770 [Polypedilum vanderplanki]|uniref:MULE transposase domain-containing protein n=1 Tax=Polypedilum vanderplanki TaxID=319348 RepID=A0A9J6CRI0_POLVA|nr:hypothetical protein PVAND_013770 [Polypedilum vanderplanki]